MVGADAYRARQHLVSKGYQANFAQAGYVSVLDARTGNLLDRLRSVKSNWRVRDFTTERGPDGSPDDALERTFDSMERVVLNQIRDITPKTITNSQRRALDLVAAIHLVRSRSFVSRHGEMLANWLPEIVNELASDPLISNVYQSQTGLDPAAGGLQNLGSEKRPNCAGKR